jgi:23S rRNA (cytosine1962-C5)-methyltransferase
MFTIKLKPSREKSVLRRHPWVFSGALMDMKETPSDAETVCITDSGGKFLAWGAYSLHSQISVRIWSWKPEETIGEEFFRSCLKRALQTREELISARQTDAIRLVHAESDGLPGLIVDRYSDTLVVQFLSSGAERWREMIVGLLQELLDPERIYERSDVDVRRLEGLPERSGLLGGSSLPERLQIQENNLKFWVDVAKGHKTGFYLDQRCNRARVGELSRDRQVLDCFCYTGGFTIHALAGGAASVVTVETSSDAIALGRQNLALNGLSSEKVNWLEGDVFKVLREFRDRDESFDLIILDPPKFAPTSSLAQQAARGYKDINLLAFKLLRPGGLLVTFSCSGGIDAALFQKIVAGAALDAGVEAQIVERLHQGIDHPVALNFPESAYLKGLVVRILGG